MKNVVIKASAGTGKTYRLSLHYIKLLLQGVNYEDILITTFTRKATQEVKERIFRHLDSLIKGNKYLIKDLNYLGIKNIDFDKVDKIYQTLLFNKDKMKISTIDSFINNMFNKFVVPYFNLYGYKMINSEKNLNYIEEVLENLIQSEKKFEELERFFSIFMEKDVTAYIKWITEFISNRWKFLITKQRNKNYRQSYNVDKSLSVVLEKLDILIKEKEQNFDLSDYLKDDFKEIAALKKENKNYKQFIEKNYPIFLNYRGETGFWNGLKLRKNKNNFKEHKALTDSYEKFKKTIASFIFNNKLIPLEKEIFKISSTIFKEYDKLKFKNREFTHDDILIYTYKFIYQFNEHSDEVFKDVINFDKAHILLDEFQDTSYVQWLIIKLIAKESKQFIAVGDEKQSIYRWRGGEKDLFVNLDKILSCRSSFLDTCYRSQKEIIQFVNSLFSNLQIVNKPVKYLPNKKHGYVEFLIAEKRELKEKLIDTFIKRDIASQNTAILARTNVDLEEIAVYLDELKVPYIKESSLSLLDHRAIKPIHALIKFITKLETFDLLIFLRSDVVNCSSTAMKVVVNHRNEISSFFDGDEVELKLDKNIIEVLSEIKGIKDRNGDIVKEILTKFNLMEIFNTKNDIKNLNRFYEISKNFIDLPSFLDYLEENVKSEQLKQLGVSENKSIKLMTIHKSKGLEFETVMLAWNFSSRFSSRNKLRLNLEFNESFENVNNFCFTSNEMGNILKYYGKNYEKIEKDKEIAEELNNFYVAVTRAKSNLIVAASFDKNLKSLDSLISRNIKNESDELNYRIKNAILKTTNRESLSSLSKEPYIKGTIYQMPIDDEDKSINKNIADFENLLKKSSTPIPLDNREEEIVVQKEKSIKKIKKGIVAHFFLSNILNEQDIEKAEKQTINNFKNNISEDVLKQVIERGANLVKSNKIFKDKDYEIFNEVSIWNANKEYRIDRLMLNKNENKIKIIDYKTGKHNEDQIKVYEQLIKNIYPTFAIESLVIDLDLK